MITVHINTKGEKKHISIEGHAEYDEEGKDVVCAAASTIFQLAMIGLEELAADYPDYIKINKEK